jgi:hypothetical protein
VVRWGAFFVSYLFVERNFLMANIIRALGSGFIGACTVTVLNLAAQRLTPNAPKLDLLGIRALAMGFAGLGKSPPKRETLRTDALVGDLISNTLYYSLVGSGENNRGTWVRALILGLAAGLGAVFLPPLMGLGKQPTQNRSTTRLLTVLWYLKGALVAATTARFLAHSSD